MKILISDEKKAKEYTFLNCVRKFLAKGSNSFFASGDFCCLLITFASSLDPYQEQQNISPVLSDLNWIQTV